MEEDFQNSKVARIFGLNNNLKFIKAISKHKKVTWLDRFKKKWKS